MLVTALLVSAGALKGFLNENHLHNIGKMLFAWTGFWAYIYFCQFMLIWYANLPEETACPSASGRQRLAGCMLALPAPQVRDSISC